MAKNVRKRKFLRKTLKKKRRKHRSINFRKKKRKSYKKKYIKNKTRKRNRNKKKIIQKGGRVLLNDVHQNILDMFDRDAMKLGLPVPIEKLVQEKQLQSIDNLVEVSKFPKSRPVGAIRLGGEDLKNHVALKGQLQDNLNNIYMGYLKSESEGLCKVSPIHSDIITKANEIIYFQNIQNMISEDMAIINIACEVANKYPGKLEAAGKLETALALFLSEKGREALLNLITDTCWEVLEKRFKQLAIQDRQVIGPKQIISNYINAIVDEGNAIRIQTGGNFKICKNDPAWIVSHNDREYMREIAGAIKWPMDFKHDFSVSRGSGKSKKLLFSPQSGTNGLLQNINSFFWKNDKTNPTYLKDEELGDLEPVWKNYFDKKAGGSNQERTWLVENMKIKINKCPKWQNYINTYKIYRIPEHLAHVAESILPITPRDDAGRIKTPLKPKVAPSGLQKSSKSFFTNLSKVDSGTLSSMQLTKDIKTKLCLEWTGTDDIDTGRNVGDIFTYISTNGKKFDQLNLPDKGSKALWFKDASIGIPEDTVCGLFTDKQFVNLRYFKDKPCPKDGTGVSGKGYDTLANLFDPAPGQNNWPGNFIEYLPTSPEIADPQYIKILIEGLVIFYKIIFIRLFGKNETKVSIDNFSIVFDEAKPKIVGFNYKISIQTEGQKKIEHIVFFSGNDISVGKVADFIQNGGLFTLGNKTTSTAKKILTTLKGLFKGKKKKPPSKILDIYIVKKEAGRKYSYFKPTKYIQVDNKTLVSWSKLLVQLKVNELQAAASMLFMKGLGDWLQTYYVDRITVEILQSPTFIKTGDKLVVGDMVLNSPGDGSPGAYCMYGHINTASDLNEILDYNLNNIDEIDKSVRVYNRLGIAPSFGNKFGIKSYNVTFLGKIFNTDRSWHNLIESSLFYKEYSGLHKGKMFDAMNRIKKLPMDDKTALIFLNKFLSGVMVEGDGSSAASTKAATVSWKQPMDTDMGREREANKQSDRLLKYPPGTPLPPRSPSLQLSGSVALFLYELTRRVLSAEGTRLAEVPCTLKPIAYELSPTELLSKILNIYAKWYDIRKNMSNLIMYIAGKSKELLEYIKNTSKYKNFSYYDPGSIGLIIKTGNRNAREAPSYKFIENGCLGLPIYLCGVKNDDHAIVGNWNVNTLSFEGGLIKEMENLMHDISGQINDFTNEFKLLFKDNTIITLILKKQNDLLNMEIKTISGIIKDELINGKLIAKANLDAIIDASVEGADKTKIDQLKQLKQLNWLENSVTEMAKKCMTFFENRTITTDAGGKILVKELQEVFNTRAANARVSRGRTRRAPDAVDTYQERRLKAITYYHLQLEELDRVLREFVGEDNEDNLLLEKLITNVEPSDGDIIVDNGLFSVNNTGVVVVDDKDLRKEMANIDSKIEKKPIGPLSIAPQLEDDTMLVESREYLNKLIERAHNVIVFLNNRGSKGKTVDEFKKNSELGWKLLQSLQGSIVSLKFKDVGESIEKSNFNTEIENKLSQIGRDYERMVAAVIDRLKATSKQY